MPGGADRWLNEIRAVGASLEISLPIGHYACAGPVLRMRRVGSMWCPFCDAEYRDGFSRCVECEVELRHTSVAERGQPPPPRSPIIQCGPVGDAGQAATLLTTVELDARVGVYRPGPVVDRSSGRMIGTARRRRELSRRPGFSLRDTDEREVLRVARKPGAWSVLTDDDERIGFVVPAMREGRRGRLVPSRMDDDPWLWTGWVLDGFKTIAYMRNGIVVDASSRTAIASLSLTHVAWWKGSATSGTWTLKITDGVEPRLRMVALAWLGIAFDLVRYVEDSD